MKMHMPKMASPKMPKPHLARPPRLREGNTTAFPTAGARAFNDPGHLVQPDQAFSAAMAMPQGSASAPELPEG